MKGGRWARLVGSAITVMGLGFVLHRFWVWRSWLLDWRLDAVALAVVLAGAGAYALNCLLLPAAWLRLLAWYEQAGKSAEEGGRSGLGQRSGLSFRSGFILYARSQIAKYAPGNVLHIVGRHAAARRLGCGDGALVGAALAEIVGQLAASGALALLGFAFMGFGTESREALSPLIIGLVLAAGICFPVVLNWLASRFGALRGLYVRGKSAGELLRGLLPGYSLYLLFYVGAGAIFLGVARVVVGEAFSGRLSGVIVAIFALAWISGFITPGASGGLGVREAVIVGGLSRFIGEPESLSVAILFRVITTLGDILFFLGSFLPGGKPDKR